jgi:hypothetical protein
MEMKKLLAIGIIFLFIGVAVAPSINSSIVKASDDNDLIEVTSKACGIQGFGNTTVKLTKEQYQNLEEYLVDFRARLNQTTTREEAVPIFKDAVVELNKFGLLPKGMSIKQAQEFVTNENHVQNISKLWVAKISKLLKLSDDGEVKNIFCLVAGNTNDTHVLTAIKRISSFFQELLYIAIIGLVIAVYNHDDSAGLFLFLLIVTLPLAMITGSLDLLRDSLLGLPLVGLGLCLSYGDYLYPAQGWISTFGILGKQSISGSIFGQKAISLLGGFGDDWYEFYYYRGVFGFQGFILVSGTDTVDYLGCASYIDVGHNRP